MSGARTGAGYERIEVATRPILGFAALLVAIVLVALGVLRWQLARLTAAEARDQVPLHPLAEAVELPPEPRLLADPGAGYEAYLAEQRAKLAEPAWIDEQAGVVRLPIERAIELLLEEGVR